MSCPCEICKKDISNLITFDNMVPNKLLFCPHCSVGLEPTRNKMIDDDGKEHFYWTFELAKRGD